MPDSLPGWLLKRARECGGANVHRILAPATPHSAAIYLLECDSTFELHVVDDAASGVDGITLPLTRREAMNITSQLAGALTGRLEPHVVRPLPPAPLEQADAKP